MEKVRSPAAAGRFYPAQVSELQRMIADYLDSAEGDGIIPKAIIAPHAGYIYSGPIAASAYKWLITAKAGDTIKRVVLLGPSHYVPCPGLALSSATAFATPLGQTPIDKKATEKISALSQVLILDSAHAQEHSLEVHLPFLQTVLSDFTLIPLSVGSTTPDKVTEVLETLWDGSETLIVISSDLSHYHNYQSAKRLDQATAQAIENLKPEDIDYDQACGRVPIQGLLYLARNHSLSVQTVDLRNSGDTAGPRDQVVGYGAWVFT
jgi:AmmeMemoRadiSam system protein B